MKNTLRIDNARIVLFDRIVRGSLAVCDGKIVGVNPPSFEADTVIDAEGKYLAPGFIDLHSHGGFGHDYMDCTDEAFLVPPKKHMEHGTTCLLITLLSADTNELYEAIKTYERVKHMQKDGAIIGGLHLEGPYFAASQCGAQDTKYLRDPDPNEYMKFLEATDDIKRWSAAPELKGALEFGRQMVKNGVLPSIAHTDATYEQVLKAYDVGYTHITHLYSSMSTVHRINAYRHAGVLESAYLIDDMTVEIIADGKHLPASLLQFVTKFKSIDRIALCTDCIRGAGLSDGDTTILGSLENGQEVIIDDGVAKLKDHSSFAGSIATCDRLVRTMITLAGCSVVQASRMASTTPAKIAGFKNKGEIKEGYDADLVIFDEDVNIAKTIIGGKVTYSAK